MPKQRLFSSRRWPFWKRRWARRIPTWRHAWKTTPPYYETWAVRREQRLWGLEPKRFELRALGYKSRCEPGKVIVQAFKARVHAFSTFDVGFLRALNEEVPRAMDRHSSGCLLSGRCPTFASDRQDTICFRIPTLIGSHHNSAVRESRLLR
jgi:hypothetical protein